MEAFLDVVWALLNTPFGLLASSSIVLYALNRLYAAKPGWAKYEGSIIAAIQYAEKAIPDDVPNKSVAKLDAALGYILRAHGEATGKAIKPKTLTAIREGVQIVHADLKAKGVLSK